MGTRPPSSGAPRRPVWRGVTRSDEDEVSARQTRLSRGCGACGRPGDHAPRFLTTRDFSELRCARAPAAQVFRLARPRADAGKQGSHCRVRVRPPRPLSARPSSPDCNAAGGFFASTALPTCSWKSPSAGRDSVLRGCFGPSHGFSDGLVGAAFCLWQPGPESATNQSQGTQASSAAVWGRDG